MEGVFGDGRAPRFVARVLDGAMTDVCREFGISRKTGYKDFFDRYKAHGLEALIDRCRRPIRYANQLPPQIENLILTLKREKRHWGARKIRELLVRRLSGDIRVPQRVRSTLFCTDTAWSRPCDEPVIGQLEPCFRLGWPRIELWCADYKGEFGSVTGNIAIP